MGRMPRLVERGKKDRRLGEPREVSWEEIEALELDPRVELIRQLIPLGLAEVGRMLEEEVEQLAGQRHARKTEDDRHCRHGHNPGSVRLGGQRHPVRVPRVRGPAGESRLAAYEQLHGSPGEMDEGLFRKVLLGISCRDYEAAVEAVAAEADMGATPLADALVMAWGRACFHTLCPPAGSLPPL